MATKEGSNRSRIIAEAIGSYVDGSKPPEKDAIDLKLIDEINVLKNDVQRPTIEAEHKDEIIRMKDDEIKRIEHMAGYYGQQSTTIIEKLAGISHALTRLLPAGPSQPPKDAIVVATVEDPQQKNRYGTG